MSHLTEAFSAELGVMMGRIRHMIEEHDARRSRNLQQWETQLTAREARVLAREEEVTRREQTLASASRASERPQETPRAPAKRICSYCQYYKCNRRESCWLLDGRENHPGHHTCYHCHQHWKQFGYQGKGSLKGVARSSQDPMASLD